MRLTGQKTALAAATLLLIASMGGGFLLLPLLVPLHIWAARRSGPIGRALWSLPPGIAAGMVTWALVYVAMGESEPCIWLVPVVAALGALLSVGSMVRPGRRATVQAAPGP